MGYTIIVLIYFDNIDKELLQRDFKFTKSGKLIAFKSFINDFDLKNYSKIMNLDTVLKIKQQLFDQHKIDSIPKLKIIFEDGTYDTDEDLTDEEPEYFSERSFDTNESDVYEEDDLMDTKKLNPEELSKRLEKINIS